ncbi:hypothetical protein [Leptolyngbya ohadii]|uniref:hypothetical protein n=1 Tax=Leptolyngbya ohadii TaxID=1962290 RepID=UPI0015C5FB52|nr:hypothetical protein [Leptolyngbya ohadii]
MFFFHFVASVLQILLFTLLAGFVLGFFGQEFKLAKAAQIEGNSEAAGTNKNQ